MTFSRLCLRVAVTSLALAMGAHAEDQPPSLVPGQALFPESGEQPLPADAAKPLTDEVETSAIPEALLEWVPGAKGQHPAVISRRVMPKYPSALRRSGHNGRVDVSILVDRDGVPGDAIVRRSAHPLLEREAVAAVLTWRFKPAMGINGEPVEARVVMPITFSLQGTERGDHQPYAIRKTAADKSYTPAEVSVAVGAVYPLALLEHGVEGSADVEMLVGQDGRVWEAKVTRASHPTIGLAAKAMYEAWTFQPARRNGEVIATFIKASKKFGRIADDMNLEPLALALVKKKASSRPKAFRLDDLDAIPVPVYRPMPVYPRALKDRKITDTVLVDFYLDENGMVLLPDPVQFVNAELAWSAATALARWQFGPPLKDGKPVLAKLRMPFAFK